MDTPTVEKGRYFLHTLLNEYPDWTLRELTVDEFETGGASCLNLRQTIFYIFCADKASQSRCFRLLSASRSTRNQIRSELDSCYLFIVYGACHITAKPNQAAISSLFGLRDGQTCGVCYTPLNDQNYDLVDQCCRCSINLCKCCVVDFLKAHIQKIFDAARISDEAALDVPWQCMQCRHQLPDELKTRLQWLAVEQEFGSHAADESLEATRRLFAE